MRRMYVTKTKPSVIGKAIKGLESANRVNQQRQTKNKQKRHKRNAVPLFGAARDPIVRRASLRRTDKTFRKSTNKK